MDGDTTRAYQETRDFIVRSIAGDIRARQWEMAEAEKALKGMLDVVDCKLETMPGVDTVTAAALIANVGDARRFWIADKLARFAGRSAGAIQLRWRGQGPEDQARQSAVRFAVPSASGTRSIQGRRELHSILYFLAIQQVQVAKVSKKPRNPVFYDYYQRKIKEGKTKKQALVCVMRRLVNIVSEMMKHRTAYVMSGLPEQEAV